MPIAPGSHALGPADGRLEVNTYREGMAARVGHDLIIEVTDWRGQAVVADDGSLVSVELSASPTSLVVRAGAGGVKPLTDADRAEIRRTIDAKVLSRLPISFSSGTVAATGEGAVEVRGDLTLGGTTRATAFSLVLAADGRVQGRVAVRQTEWGIKPYSALMGTLKVRDEVDVVLDARLPIA